MTRFGIDARTLLHVVREERPLGADHQLVAPNALRSHALQLLLDEVRAGYLDEPSALALHTRLTEVKVRLLGDRVSRRTAWDLAREHDWPTLEHAEVLAVTRLQADALVTMDTELRSLAAGIVPLADLADLG